MSVQPVSPTHNLTELSRQALDDLFQSLGEPSFRSGQIFDWIHKKGVRSLDEMTNLPKQLKQRLEANGYRVGRVAVNTLAISTDGTRKLSIRLEDGGVVETVLIPMGDGEFTQCISSQVGCAPRMRFLLHGDARIIETPHAGGDGGPGPPRSTASS